MNPLISHFVQNNIDEIVEKSLFNCHVKGMHSVMLSETPGKTIRLYIADHFHELWKNEPTENDWTKGMSLAFHPHHCNLTLHVVFGTIRNLEAATSLMTEFPNYGITIDRWIYQSQINTGKMEFDLVQPDDKLVITRGLYLSSGDCSFMKANDIHTVSVGKHRTAVWLVYEGKEDPEYRPYAWSNTDLGNVDTTGMYKKPTKEQILSLLKRFSLI